MLSRDASLRAGERSALSLPLPPSDEPLLVEWSVAAAEHDVAVSAAVLRNGGSGGGSGGAAGAGAGVADADADADAAVVYPRLRVSATGACAFVLAPSARAREFRVELDNSYSRLRGKTVYECV